MTDNACAAALVAAAAGAIAVHESRHAPLTKTADDGSAVDVLFWMFPGLDGRPAIVVHPDRLNAFKAVIAEVQRVTPVAERGITLLVPRRPFLWFRVPPTASVMTQLCAQGPGSCRNPANPGETEDPAT